MMRVGDTFRVGDAEFVTEQVGTGEVVARCTRPDPTNALGYAPLRAYSFGDSPACLPRPSLHRSQERPLLWLLLAAVGFALAWWFARHQPGTNSVVSRNCNQDHSA